VVTSTNKILQHIIDIWNPVTHTNAVTYNIWQKYNILVLGVSYSTPLLPDTEPDKFPAHSQGVTIVPTPGWYLYHWSNDSRYWYLTATHPVVHSKYGMDIYGYSFVGTPLVYY
jgi:hypothetical protein